MILANVLWRNRENYLFHNKYQSFSYVQVTATALNFQLSLLVHIQNSNMDWVSQPKNLLIPTNGSDFVCQSSDELISVIVSSTMPHGARADISHDRQLK